MKLAIVFDDLIQFGGAEKLLMAVLEIWPNVPLYTSFASKEWQDILKKKGVDLRTSFMQKLPFKKRLNRFYGAVGLHVFAMESFDFSEYDLVFSISARYAHGVITKPHTKHICYMNSPGRMFWEPCSYFSHEGFFGKLAGPSLFYHRLWDYSASHRVDKFIANSLNVKKRIMKYYNLESDVVYPFYESFVENWGRGWSSYFLVISRLLAWKNIDIAIKACGELKIPLKIIGDGPYAKVLKNLAKPYENIDFLGYVGEDIKYREISRCMALIQTQHEDFGITPLEVMACGKPVIAFGAGGALETVIADKTGEFFYPQDVESLKTVLRIFTPEKYKPEECAARARDFSKEKFQQKIRRYIDDVYLEKS